MRKEQGRKNQGLPIFYWIVWIVNRIFCCFMYRIPKGFAHTIPDMGPAIVVSDHSSYSDPLVLSATTKRAITYLIAKEVFNTSFLKWMFQAFHYIPVSRGNFDMKAVRALLVALDAGEVVGVFPEGGIDECRQENGYPGAGYLALKTGAPIVPVSIVWKKTRPLYLLASLITPGKVSVRYGIPFVLQSENGPNKEQIAAATERIMQAIQELRAATVEPMECTPKLGPHDI